METVWRYLKKLKLELPYDPAIPPLGKENHDSRGYMHLSVHCTTIYNSQDIEATSMPVTREWIKRMWYIYTMDFYSAIKGTTLYHLKTWLHQETVIQSEVRKIHIIY